ncbi:MAG: threonine--tRNA ligase [Defluviitaleaceae bacterium]|nr:threonine--tRNA ligase [Defluviitaleaceae bacterium]
MKITLKGGIEKEYASGTTAYDIARDLSEGLARAACAARMDSAVVDLRQPITDDCALEILTFDDPDGRKAFRHTASHVLAQAVLRLYPGVKLAIGPSTDEGFYYDFDRDSGAFTAEEIPVIEAEIKKIIKEDPPIERFTLPRDKALELVADEPYKVELINDLPEDAEIGFYTQGGFTDLCAGPHLMNMKPLKGIKLISEAGSSGAYWRGSEKNKMLSRIYGTAFPKTSELEEYLIQREEAKKRDHNKLGRELGIFTSHEAIGQGLPLLMPKGAKIFQILTRFVEDEEERRGYVLTKTPYMAKSDLYKISGHWDLYREGMFIMGEADDPYALRPMTCPFQFTIYNAGQHSYRDLPIRYGETATLFRNESSGEMHGLIRVRQFTISEGHLVMTREQLGDEFRGVVDLANFMMKTFGIENDISYRFSMWDPDNKDKYVGEPEHWEEAQEEMEKLLNELGLDFVKAPGEAAFYGPKLDIQFRNVHGKEDTVITIQIDFALAERFGMTYTERDGSKKNPIIIHRTSIGCYERTIAMLIEKYAGAFPTWLSPTQVIVLPISDKYSDYAGEVYAKLKAKGIRAEIDNRAEKIGYKIREARNERIPYILVAGEKEAAAGTVSLRSRAGDEGEVTVEQVIERVTFETETRVNNSGS